MLIDTASLKKKQNKLVDKPSDRQGIDSCIEAQQNTSINAITS